LADAKQLASFVTAELNRAIFTYEENAFINGTESDRADTITNERIASLPAEVREAIRGGK
jgi:hypothetical protein